MAGWSRSAPSSAISPSPRLRGAGTTARDSIGLALVGGMFIVTFFTPFVALSIHMLIARDHSRNRMTRAFIMGCIPSRTGRGRFNERLSVDSISAILVVWMTNGSGLGVEKPGRLYTGLGKMHAS